MLECSNISHIVKIHDFFKNLLLYSHAYIRQTKYKVMMTKERSTQNYMTPWAGVLMLGRGHISHFSEYVLYSAL